MTVPISTVKRYRSVYAKFRCGVAPIKIETCRYGLNRVPVDQRVCETCNVVEDQFYVMMLCSVYDDIRLQYILHIPRNVRTNFSEAVLQLEDSVYSSSVYGIDQ